MKIISFRIGKVEFRGSILKSPSIGLGIFVKPQVITLMATLNIVNFDFIIHILNIEFIVGFDFAYEGKITMKEVIKEITKIIEKEDDEDDDYDPVYYLDELEYDDEEEEGD